MGVQAAVSGRARLPWPYRSDDTIYNSGPLNHNSIKNNGKKQEKIENFVTTIYLVLKHAHVGRVLTNASAVLIIYAIT